MDRGSWRRLVAGCVVAALVLVGCGDDPKVTSAKTVVQGVDAVTVAARPDGTLLWLERAAGTLQEEGMAPALATVPSDPENQGGLLGLAVNDAGRIFIAWVGPDRLLQVAEVEAQGLRPVWEGVEANAGGLGGRLAMHPDGRLVLGMGNATDLSALGISGGAMVTLEVDGPADQVPVVLSSPWNNPFAFGFTPSGDLWVADNHPSDGDERLARADLGPEAERVTVMPSKFAASGLTAISDTELWVCSFSTQRIDRYRINDAGIAERSGTVANDCRFDITTLPDGRVAYSTGEAIKVIDPAEL